MTIFSMAFTVLTILQAVEATDNSSAVPKHMRVETPTNMSLENKAHFLAEKEAIHLILTGIGDDIYSTVDAFQTAQEMWEAIERLQQGESLNIQDVKTNLFWEFGKFTSHDGESMESYYTGFYKSMNEMIRNNLIVTTMKVNVQLRQQLQSEWSRFVMIVKQQHKLDKVSYHKLFDILKQYQNEVNELRAEKLARNANPLALNKNVDTTPRFKNDSQFGQFGNQRTVNVVAARENVGSTVFQQSGIQCFNCKEYGHFAKECRKPKRVKDSAYHKEKMLLSLVATAQADRDPYFQTSRSHRSSAPSPKPSIPSRSRTSTRHKGKEIAKLITPPSETASEEDIDPKQAQRDKDMQKNLALIAKYFKKIYKPTNNNLRTSSNSKNKNLDTTPRKPKRVKDSAYHKEKMLLCKQAEQGVLL
nr:hypothetical protein [Tanacetum cinerariifolium]